MKMNEDRYFVLHSCQCLLSNQFPQSRKRTPEMAMSEVVMMKMKMMMKKEPTAAEKMRLGMTAPDFLCLGICCSTDAEGEKADDSAARMWRSLGDVATFPIGEFTAAAAGGTMWSNSS